MFFIATEVASRQSYAEIMSRYGLNPAAQTSALAHPRNAHLRSGGTPPDPTWRTAHAVNLCVPIDVRLSVTEYRPVINLVEGLRPRLVGAVGPPTLTHGLSIRISRNLGAGTGLNWIQTVRKLNNSDQSQPLEFVDSSGDGLPFYGWPEPGRTIPLADLTDVPCGLVAPRRGGGVDFTATTTLAVIVGDRVILAAGKTWRFIIGTDSTLPSGVHVTPHRDASASDFANQLRILRFGINQYRDPTGANLNYLLPPAPNSIVP